MQSTDVQTMLQNMFPGKTVTLSYDDSCIGGFEFAIYQGKLNPTQMVKYNKVLATVQDNPIPPTYYSVDYVVGDMPVAQILTYLASLPINS